MSPLLLCITPSPAVDRTARVERIRIGEVLRPLEIVALPGGKGVNAARAAMRLDAPVITTGVAGGHAGRWIVEALHAEGLQPRFAAAAAESRTTYVTVDAEGESVIVYERPAAATEAEFSAFVQLLEEDLLPRCGRAVVAGSVPAGIGLDGHVRIVEAARRAQRPLLVDASGDGLVAALTAGPDVVKVGRTEVVEAGLVPSTASSLQSALVLVERGAVLAIVTDGPRDVVAADRSSTWQAEVPSIEAINPVGSGDAFNAGLSLALMAGDDVATALARGVAAGAANALALGAGMLDGQQARELESRVRVTMARR